MNHSFIRRMHVLLSAFLLLLPLTACIAYGGPAPVTTGPHTTAAPKQTYTPSDDAVYVAVHGSVPDWLKGSSVVSAGNGRFWQLCSLSEQGGVPLAICSIAAAGGDFQLHPYVFADGHSPNGIAPIPGDEGGLWFIESVWNNTQTGRGSYESHTLVRTDAAGETVVSEDITRLIDTDRLTFIAGAARSDGGCYMYIEGTIFCFDWQGKLLFELDAGQVTDIPEFARTADGTVVAALTANGVTKLCVIDEISRQLVTLMTAEQNAGLHPADGDDFFDLYVCDEALYGVDLLNGEKTPILTFADVNINHHDVIRVLPDGVSETGAPKFGCYELYGTLPQPASLEQRTAEPEKITLTLAGAHKDQALEKVVNDFNRRSVDYHIEYIEYTTPEDPAGTTGLSIAIATGDIPDMLDLYMTPEHSLIKKDVLCDLTPYMEADEELSPDKFLPNLLPLLTYSDDAVYGLAPGYYADAFFTLHSRTGAVQEWSYAVLNDILDRNPQITQPVARRTKEYGPQLFLYSLIEQYVDFDSLTSHFDSEDFIEFLEFARRFPEPGTVGDASSQEVFEDGTALLLNRTVFDLMSYVGIREEFGDDTWVVGYPGSGVLVNFWHRVGITNECEDTQGAWEFIREYMMSLQGEDPLTHMPVLEAEHEDMLSYWRSYYIKAKEQKTMSNGKPIYQPTEEDFTIFDEIVRSFDSVMAFDPGVYDILYDELTAFLDGVRTAEETAEVIQSRVELVLAEMQ